MRIKIVASAEAYGEPDLRDTLKQDIDFVSQTEEDLGACDLVILLGDLAHGEYLLTAMPRIMDSVESFAGAGGYVFGLCSGFRILCEAGLLPGALVKNTRVEFLCTNVYLRVETAQSPLTKCLRKGQILKIPMSQGNQKYYADHTTLDELVDKDCVLFRYSTPDGLILPEADPNGSAYNIAGICNNERNVFGMMPHGLPILEPLIRSVEAFVGEMEGELPAHRL